MKLLINASILSKRNTGLGVYTYHVIKYLVPLLEQNNIDFKILTGSVEYLPDCAKSYVLIIDCSNPFKRLKEMNDKCKDFDIFYSTTQHTIKSKKIKQIITIHDVTPIEYPRGRIKQTMYYKFFLKKYVKNVNSIITVSNHTKQDISHHFKVNLDKIEVFYSALPEEKNIVENSISFRQIEEKYSIEMNKYFVITGIHYLYKNIQLVIQGYKNSLELRNYKVVIIGNDNNKYGNYLKKMIKKYTLSDYFVFSGFISDLEKKILLENSKGAIYPSKYEGFGLPILEAMNAKIPLYLSNVSSLPEIAEDYAFYFNPKSVDDFINCLTKNINNKKEIEKKIALGEEYLAKYNWKIIANNICNLIIEEENK